eukprot:4516328-Pyramimonas_sp.AAC.1
MGTLRTKKQHRKVPQRDSIRKPHYMSPLRRRGAPLGSLTTGPCWKAPHRDSIEKPYNEDPLESATTGFCGTSSVRIFWYAPQKGFYGKTSQQESVGKHHKEIILGSITPGIRWRAPQRDHI